MFCLAVAVYSTARRLPIPRAGMWCLAASGAALLHLLVHPAAIPGAVGLLPALAWVAIPFTVGAARRLVSEAGARERAEAERRLVDAERLRLAQEVHDVVSHGLAAIQMQADVALHVQHKDPAQANKALVAISRASCQALTELRSTLASIYPGEPSQATRAPTPGLALIDDLRDRVEHAGITVDLEVSGIRPIAGSAGPSPGSHDQGFGGALPRASTSSWRCWSSPGQPESDVEITVDDRPNAWPLQLDDDVKPAVQGAR